MIDAADSLYSRLGRAENLRVAYLGGSITEGAGASQANLAWRARTTEWLRRRFARSQVSEINAGIGGTGSDLGAFRLQHDVLRHSPDLVFVEFAVNDRQTNRETVLRSLEGIVRQLHSCPRDIRCVLVLTTCQPFEAEIREHGKVEVLRIHEQVAGHYGLPCLRPGPALLTEVLLGRLAIGDYLPDGFHPNDAGHAFYADVVVSNLEELFQRGETAKARPTGALHACPWENASLVSAQTFCAGSWRCTDTSLCARYPNFVECTEPDAELTIEFPGTTLGIYWMLAPDGGNLDFRIDDGNWQTVAAWDAWAPRGPRAHYAILADALDSCTHRAVFRVSRTRPRESRGHAIRIAAFLVDQPAKDPSTLAQLPFVSMHACT